MFSKLNYYKFQGNWIDPKETKFEKYLRERNEKILEKCFNIKVEGNEALKELQETKNEKLPEQPTNMESYKQTNENISLIKTNKIEEEDLPQALVKGLTENGCSLKTVRTKNSKPKSSIKIMQSRNNTPRNLTPVKTTKSHSTPLASSKNWKSPFTSFTTKGIRNRLQGGQQSSEFSYDLSRDELKFSGRFRNAMRPAPAAERQLLNSGQRKEYLTHRYEHAPVVKYNYPEATSWRIGWLLQKQ